MSERQPPMYFRLGGGTVKGISKPGEIVWSRIFVGRRQAQSGFGPAAGVRELPIEETERRWRSTTPQWPIMHAVTYGITRDQMMARHKSNHIQVAYAPDAAAANRALGGESGCVPESGVGCEHLRNFERSRKLRRNSEFMRVGMIGTGAISHKHAQAYANIGYQLTACTDINAESGRAFAR